MKERLNQISLYDFIEISCGNYQCLLAKGESVSNDELKERASKLIVDYRNIVNPIGMKAMLLDREDMVKERSKLLLLRICQTLISIDSYDDVRGILNLLNVNTQVMDNDQVKSKLEYMLHSALFEQKRNDERRNEESQDKKATSEQIRASFDSETAFLMTYFKMNIDVYSTNAAVYANIVHQADVEICAKRKK